MPPRKFLKVYIATCSEIEFEAQDCYAKDRLWKVREISLAVHARVANPKGVKWPP